MTQLKNLVVNQAAVTSVLTIVTSAIAGTAAKTTVNKVEEKIFLQYIKNFIMLIKTDQFSVSIRYPLSAT